MLGYCRLPMRCIGRKYYRFLWNLFIWSCVSLFFFIYLLVHFCGFKSHSKNNLSTFDIITIHSMEKGNNKIILYFSSMQNRFLQMSFTYKVEEENDYIVSGVCQNLWQKFIFDSTFFYDISQTMKKRLIPWCIARANEKKKEMSFCSLHNKLRRMETKGGRKRSG